jgi:hypothetical protein
MASLPRKLATGIVARYPRAWRERYADEVLALVEDRSAGWGDVFDLIRNAITEWRLSVTSPDEHFVVAGIVLRVTPLLQAMLLAIAFQGLATAVVPFLHAAITISKHWALVGLVVPLAFLLRAIALPLMSIAVESGGHPPPLQTFSRREIRARSEIAKLTARIDEARARLRS